MNQSIGKDGNNERGGFMKKVNLKRSMWDGGDFKFRDDIRVGEIVKRN